MKEKKMKLIDSLNEVIPYRYIELIMENMDDPKEINSSHFLPIGSELMSLFDWEISNEGYEFWNEVHLFIVDLGELPFIPVDIEYAPDTLFYTDSGVNIMNLSGHGLCIRFNIEGEDAVGGITPKLKEQLLVILN